jgi:hypothetical protein
MRAAAGPRAPIPPSSSNRRAGATTDPMVFQGQNPLSCDRELRLHRGTFFFRKDFGSLAAIQLRGPLGLDSVEARLRQLVLDGLESARNVAAGQGFIGGARRRGSRHTP